VLLERDGELGLVDAALRSASGGAGGVVAIGGSLGNGKTALLRSLASLPAAAEMHVLQAGASPLEQDFAFGVVRQLLEPALGKASQDVWSGAAGLARSVFAAEEPAGPARPVAIADAVLFGLHALIGNLGAGRPLLILVDDLHWVDHPSLRWLSHLAKRIEQLPVALVVTVREGDPLADAEMTDEIVAHARHRARPRSLSPRGSAAVVRARLGPLCDDEFALACHDATDGNPMLLTALVHDLATGGPPPVRANAGAVRAMRPAQSRDRLIGCLRAQPEPVRRLAAALAVLSDHADLPLAGSLAGLDDTATTGAARALRKLGLVVGERFAHRGVQDAVEDMMTESERTGAHERAVRLLLDHGKPDEQVANQLLSITTPQGPWVVDVLRTAADTAGRRGAPDVAARYLRRALLDTSVDGEDRARVLVDLATVERGFDMQAAVRHISYAVPLLGRTRDRAAAVIRLAPTVLADVQSPVVAMLDQIGYELGDPDQLSGVDRDLALRVEARLRHVGETSSAELSATAARLAALGPTPPVETSAERELLTVLLHAATLSARAPAARLAAVGERVLAHEPASPAHVYTAMPLLVVVLAAADSPRTLTTWLDMALELARTRGDAVEQALIRTEQSLVHLHSGQLAEAAAAAAEAYELGALNWNTAGSTTAIVSGAVALQLRDPVLTEQLLSAFGEHQSNACLNAVVGLLRGSSAVLRGDSPTAVAALLDCGRQLDRSGWRNPVLFPWRSSAALIQRGLGKLDSAFELVEEERLIAQEWGAPSGIGRALRVLGALRGERRGLELTRDAVEVLTGSNHKLELARALKQWAEMSDDAEVWRRCLRVAVDCGAKSIAERAWTALGVSSAATPAPRLTRAERKVAQLAVAGLTNQCIADELGVTSRAVEKHLTNTYRKLGVHRRAELGEALRRSVDVPQ